MPNASELNPLSMHVHSRQDGETTNLSRRAAVSAATAGAALALAPLSVKPAAAAAPEQEYVYLTSASGLQYCDVREGDGDAPTKGESIRCVCPTLQFKAYINKMPFT
eukprot:1799460-Pyramimonas_sp.AAC.1